MHTAVLLTLLSPLGMTEILMLDAYSWSTLADCFLKLNTDLQGPKLWLFAVQPSKDLARGLWLPIGLWWRIYYSGYGGHAVLSGESLMHVCLLNLGSLYVLSRQF